MHRAAGWRDDDVELFELKIIIRSLKNTKKTNLKNQRALACGVYKRPLPTSTGSKKNVYNMGKPPSPPSLPTMTPTSSGPNAANRRGSLRLITQLQPTNVMPFSMPVPKGAPFPSNVHHTSPTTRQSARAQDDDDDDTLQELARSFVLYA